MCKSNFSIALEQQISNLMAITNKIELLGDAGNQLAVTFALIIGTFGMYLERIQERNDDYDNCFDAKNCKKIAKEIKYMLNDIQSFWKDTEHCFVGCKKEIKIIKYMLNDLEKVFV